MTTVSHPLVRVVDDVQLLTLHGHIGIMTVDELHSAARVVADTPSAEVVVDCAAVEHFDGAAIQVLVALDAALAKQGHALRFRGIAPSLARYLRIAGVERWLDGMQELEGNQSHATRSEDDS